MADYKELLRRAVDALPENNGGARRAVYEKARAALVGQLRAINPPLPARDITTHRLQLEDCIRQVEQEASEANIAGMVGEPAAPPNLPPVFASEAKKPAPKPEAEPEPVKAKAEPPKPPQQPIVRPEPVAKGKAAANGTASIEDIIAAAERDRQPALPKASDIKSRPPKSQPVLVKSDAPEPEPSRPAGGKSEDGSCRRSWRAPKRPRAAR